MIRNKIIRKEKVAEPSELGLTNLFQSIKRLTC